nr:ubiquitin-specific protease 13 [Tanacetum cinerariifolium]
MKRKVGKEDQVVRQTQNSKYYESLETPPIKRTVGRPKKSVSANEIKSSSVKRRGRPTKGNDEEKNQTVGSKDNFDTETNVLSLNDSSILVTSESVNDILGIPMGGCSIESLEPRTADDPFIKEWLSQFGERLKFGLMI